MSNSNPIRILGVAACCLGVLFFVGKAINSAREQSMLPTKTETSKALENVVAEANAEPQSTELIEPEDEYEVVTETEESAEIYEELPEEVPPVPEPPSLPPVE
jgi:hypothetical protein